ncbi:MAG: hypothetical protein AVDCRST_MAG52-1239, partial [uncultured Blastococcus sp.]
DEPGQHEEDVDAEPARRPGEGRPTEVEHDDGDRSDAPHPVEGREAPRLPELVV